MSETWAIVCTMKEPRQVVERFVSHHLALGCSELFLFFSDPMDAALAWAREQPRVRAEPIQEVSRENADGRGDRQSQFGVYTTTDEKLLISAAVADQRSAADWIIHLDADEYLSADEPIGDYLASVDPDVWMVNVAPIEAVYERFDDSLTDYNTTLFRRRLPYTPVEVALCAQLYGAHAGMFRHGLLGHTAGKSFIRRSPEVAEIGIHFGRHADPSKPVLHEIDRVKLLHFDALSFERWRRKFLMRVHGDFISPATGEHRRNQRAAFEAVMHDDRGLEALFRNLLVLEGERLQFAADHAMVERRLLQGAATGTATLEGH